MIDSRRTLAQVREQLKVAQGLEDIQGAVKMAARQLTGADGATFVLLDGDRCYYADEDSISPLWKGQRFPVSACISGWAMVHEETVVISDIRRDERIPQEAYRPTFVRSLAMVPMLSTEPLGAIGAYWARAGRPSADAVAALEQLAGSAALALRRFPERLPDPSFYVDRTLSAG
ncbi:MAG TPA: GAF domain-containing protein [Mycobacterium sp.]|nr:GAF domain-containing protein [Mycobacterium sp.]